jgi:hypothetical protein
MIGVKYKLTFDKANQVFSYFLKSIQIAHDHGGRVSRIGDFAKEMSLFCNGEMLKNGEENRAWYNKSLYPRYYGFLDVEHTTNFKEGDYIVSTPRGERLLELVESRNNTADKSNETTLYIPQENLLNAYELFYEALTFGSFGKNNTGAEKSMSDIDPPKVMMKVIYELNEASKEEICYCIYALHRGVGISLADIIETVKTNRLDPAFSYSTILKEWDLTNIATDFKLAKLLADPGIALFTMRKDSRGMEWFKFNKNVPEELRKKFALTDGVYRPMKWLVTINDLSEFPHWVRKSVAGGTHNDDEVFVSSLVSNSFGSDILLHEFKDAILTAFSKPTRNVYFAISAQNSTLLEKELGKYARLLDRIDDCRNEYHGWSKTSIEDEYLYEVLSKRCSKFRGPDGKTLVGIFEKGAIKLPSNFHFIGGVTDVK